MFTFSGVTRKLTLSERNEWLRQATAFARMLARGQLVNVSAVIDRHIGESSVLGHDLDGNTKKAIQFITLAAGALSESVNARATLGTCAGIDRQGNNDGRSDHWAASGSMNYSVQHVERCLYAAVTWFRHYCIPARQIRVMQLPG